MAATFDTSTLTAVESEAVGQLSPAELSEWKRLVALEGLTPMHAVEELRAEYLTQFQVLPALERARAWRRWVG